MPNLQNKNGIEWCHQTWNPLKGECLNTGPCKEYCYMQRMYQRFPEMRQPIHINEKEFAWVPRKPQVVFACSRLDLLHPEMKKEWQEAVLARIRANMRATYVILTKFPRNYAKFDWPTNCWLGTTVDGLDHTIDNVYWLLRTVPRHYTRFVSVEPLLKQPHEWWILSVPPVDTHHAYIPDQYGTVNWAIIGADSTPGAKKPPDWWADTLINACRRMQIPVIVKNNYNHHDPPKEMPEGWLITPEGELIQTAQSQLTLL